MSEVKIETFLSKPPTPDGVHLSQMLENLQEKFGETLQITIFGKDDDLFKAYNLTSTPAVVIGEMVKIMGFCPSEESIISALKDLGIK